MSEMRMEKIEYGMPADFHPQYAVTDDGRVYKTTNRQGETLDPPHEVSASKSTHGYRIVRVKDERGKYKQLKLGMVLAKAFLGMKEGEVAGYKDKDPANLSLDNLQIKRITNNTPITPELAKAIYNDPRSGGQIAKHYGLNNITVNHIKYGYTWSHVTGAVKRKYGKKKTE